MSEVAFLEPLEENANKSSDDEQEKTTLDLEDKEDDGEGNVDPEIQKKMDDENMAAATDKIIKKF